MAEQDLTQQQTPRHDFVVKQGAVFTRTIRFRNQESGELLSLDGLMSAELAVSPVEGTPFVITDGPSDRFLIIDKPNKEIRIYIADEVTDTYTWRTASYELNVTDSAGDIARKLRGKLLLEKKVA